MKVIKWYHGGRDPVHRERDRALVRAGAELVSVIPADWPGPADVRDDAFELVELPVHRPGDVNRHRLAHPEAFAQLVARERPDIVDLYCEPFSHVAHQLLRELPPRLPVIGYTAQNIDKRFPPPFAQWERAALGRLTAMYPCSRQAASVIVGKGFTGPVRVLPLPAPNGFVAGDQRLDDPLQLMLVGRLVPEKGVRDAVRVLAAVRRSVPARLAVVGSGPEAESVRRLAAELGVSDALELHPWTTADRLAELYRAAHVVLAPSRPTPTWVEQFGRMVVEAQASGAVVVAYASGALPEVVADAGVLVPVGDVDAMAREVLALQGDADRWSALRERGLAGAPTHDEVARDQLALMRAALDAPVRARRVRAHRTIAHDRFGPPALVAGSARPFALPVLRRDTVVSRELSRICDRVSPDQRAPGTRLRVVYLDHVARLSGGEIALARLIAATRNVDAHVILGEDGPLRGTLEELGATVEVLPLAASGRLAHRDEIAGPAAAVAVARYVVMLARRLRELQPDLVHTNSLKAGYYGSLAARPAGVPVVWHLRDRLAADYLPDRAARLTRLLLRRLPDLVISNSRATADCAGVPSLVIHDPYRPTRGPVQQDHAFTIGMVGRIAPWKGQDVLLRAVARLVAERPDVQVRICGAPMFDEHDWLRSLEQLVGELGLGGHVTFAGFRDDVEAELASFDVLVHASRSAEPFGQVVLEGMAAGLAVVASDAGGPREIVTDGVDGLLVPPGDDAALADALLSLTDRDRRARLGAAALIRARDFDPEIIGPQVEDAYRSVLGMTATH